MAGRRLPVGHVIRIDAGRPAEQQKRRTAATGSKPTFGTSAAGGQVTQDVTVTGAALGDSVSAVWMDVSLSGASAMMELDGFVHSANTVRVVAMNTWTGASDPLSGTLYVRVRKET